MQKFHLIFSTKSDMIVLLYDVFLRRRGCVHKMATIKFINQPAYIYDLLTIFLLYFNKTLWNSRLVNLDKSADDIGFYNRVMSEFRDIPDDLLIFFYMRENVSNFMTHTYFHGKASDHLRVNDFSFEKFRDMVSDSKTLASSLFAFYFPEAGFIYDVKDETLIDKIIDAVEVSIYPDAIKHHLLAFFVSPDKFTRKLTNDLTSKDALLSKYYEANYRTKEFAQDNFDFDSFSKTLISIEGKEFSFDTNNTVFVSICLIAKGTVQGFFSQNLCLIGYDYIDSLAMVINRSVAPNLEMLGKILSEKNRVIILDLLHECGEKSTSDVAKHLNVSVNAAYYHLDMMLQNDMVFARNEGRTVFYRLNRSYFKSASQAMIKYGKSN